MYSATRDTEVSYTQEDLSGMRNPSSCSHEISEIHSAKTGLSQKLIIKVRTLMMPRMGLYKTTILHRNCIKRLESSPVLSQQLLQTFIKTDSKINIVAEQSKLT